MNNYDDIFYSQEDKEERSNKTQTVEDLTQGMIKLFVKEHRTTLILNLSQAHSQDLSEPNKIEELMLAIKQLKDKFNIFFIDVYCDYSHINKNIEEEIYLRYANRCLNKYLVQNYLNTPKSKPKRTKIVRNS